MDTSFPPLTVLIVTYDRPTEIRRIITALQEHVVYAGEIDFHFADDGSPGNYVADLLNDYRLLHPSHTITRREGWGANVNKALASISSDYVFLIEDDYVAIRDIDLTRGVALLQADDSIGIVRYDGIEGHTINLKLRELDTDIGRLNYLRIDKDSPHLNVYSNRPHLRHRRVYSKVGTYKEGLRLGATEEEFAHRIKDGTNIDVVILPEGVPRAFDHIGKSRQGTDEDRGH